MLFRASLLNTDFFSRLTNLGEVPNSAYEQYLKPEFISRFLLLLFLLFAIPASFSASHVIGGSIHYQYLSGDSCEITLTLYRDCSSNTQYDDPVSIGCFNSAGDLIYNLEIDLSNAIITSVETESSNACYMAPLGLCVQEAFFTGVAILPHIAGGYTLTYQRCCRNFSIVNVPTGTDVGITLTTEIPGTELVAENSNPEFASHPPLIICLNAPFTFDHSATDADGDQLVYEFCEPLNTNVSGSYINPPGSPPYNGLSYNAGYSAVYPIDSSPAFIIDEETGVITGTPTSLGQYVVGVCISEYRNGVLINVTNRDFQLNVTNCAAIDSPAIANQENICSGLTVNFLNGSVEDLTYHWDFGVAEFDADTSNLFEPTYTYSEAGTYAIMLILNPGLPCADTTFAQYVSSPGLIPAISQYEYSCTQNQLLYSFIGLGGTGTNTEFLWTFDNGVSTFTNSNQNPENILLGSAGSTVNVSLQVSESGCSETITQSVSIPTDVTASIEPQSTFCDGYQYQFNNLSQNATEYYWDFGVNGTSDFSIEEDPQYTFADTGYYQVTLIATAFNLCPDTTITGMLIYGMLQPYFDEVPLQCLENNEFDFLAQGASTDEATYNWNFGLGALPMHSTSSNPSGVHFNAAGFFDVSLTIAENDCLETYTAQVELVENPVASIEPQNVFCNGLTFQFGNSSMNATDYDWDFGEMALGSISSDFEPIHSHSDSGYFEVMLIASMEDLCNDTTFLNLELFEMLDAYFQDQPAQCFEGNAFDFLAEGFTSNNASIFWDFGVDGIPDSNSLISQSNIHFANAGVFEVSLTIQEHNCTDVYTSEVEVILNPNFSAETDTIVQCDFGTAFSQGTTIYNTPVQYFWDFGDGANAIGTEVSHQYTEAGVYDVEVTMSTSEGCIETQSIFFNNVIRIEPSPVPGFLISNQHLSLLNPEADITSVAENATECYYIISDGGSSDSFNFSYSFLKPGYTDITQYVTSEFGCKAHITGIVIVDGFAFYAPNSFTPDDDGVNDVWKPETIGVTEYALSIFNRWGDQVFETADPKQPWTGEVHNGDYFAQDGAYNYVAVVRDLLGLPHEFHGHILLIR